MFDAIPNVLMRVQALLSISMSNVTDGTAPILLTALVHSIKFMLCFQTFCCYLCIMQMHCTQFTPISIICTHQPLIYVSTTLFCCYLCIMQMHCTQFTPISIIYTHQPLMYVSTTQGVVYCLFSFVQNAKKSNSVCSTIDK